MDAAIGFISLCALLSVVVIRITSAMKTHRICNSVDKLIDKLFKEIK